ncbi:hypothetical protein LPJ66_001446 [Kickxella alabastrina]|uniref:Uncharacterized protein n=1 Tax=Kickxella alabastrina TaxID=61397 RepID=A0ACC1ITI4_9FUNG|nr:hypothetical protein LPJ66_001446 [Kickxella alabastrina]
MQYSLATLCLRLFPKLRPTQKNTTWGLYLTRAVPCGLASALDIGLSNISLRTITLTFYTMCKSSGLGFVLLFAFLFGLERVRFVLIAVIAIITVGVVLMAAGEVDFNLMGFTQVVSSAAMSGLRWSLTQILLSQARFGMNNPVATMSRLMPIIGASMLAFSLILEQPVSQLPRDKNMQSLGDVLFIVVMMGVGGCFAFAMVLSEFFLIARTSVVTLSIAGMLKEVVMIGVAHLIFGDSMTLVNASGLLVTLFGIAMYNWLKIHDTMNGQVDEDSSSNAHGDDSGGRGVDESQLRQLVFATGAYDEIAAADFVFEEDSLDTQTENQERLRGNNLTSNSANTSAGSDMFDGHSRFANSPPKLSFSDAATKRTLRSSSSQSTDTSVILDHDEVTPGPMRLKNRE